MSNVVKKQGVENPMKKITLSTVYFSICEERHNSFRAVEKYTNLAGSRGHSTAVPSAISFGNYFITRFKKKRSVEVRKELV